MDQCDQTGYLAHIDFKQIQTWLFSQPLYKIIKGKNAALGQLIRHDLTQLAIESQPTGGLSLTLPEWFDTNLIEQDPLSEIKEDALSEQQLLYADHPSALYQKSGILSRDGGHFRVLFLSEDSAKNFLLKACLLIQEKLPSLRFDAGLEQIFLGAKTSNLSQIAVQSALSGHTALTLSKTSLNTDYSNASRSTPSRVDAPIFRRCDLTGIEPAQDSFHINPEKSSLIGKTSNYYLNIGTSFNQGKSCDIASLLQQRLLQHIEQSSSQPQDFMSKAQGQYIALILIDGDQTGQRLREFFQQFSTTEQPHAVSKEQQTCEFFYRRRARLRAALVSALQKVFIDHEAYDLLMVGGDDIALVTQSQQAFRFVTELSQQLDELQNNLPAYEQQKLSFGVTIAPTKYPMDDLFAVSEQMLASAKQKTGHTIDWHIIKASNLNNVFEVRQATTCYTQSMPYCLYSLKPYCITTRIEPENDRTLSELIKDADTLYNMVQDKSDSEPAAREIAQIARRQLKRLVSTLSQVDFAHVLLIWHELPNPLQDQLKAYKPKWDDSSRLVLSALLDLIELVDLPYLGNVRQPILPTAVPTAEHYII